MDATARQIFELAFVIAWIGGGLYLYVRMRIVQREFFLNFGYDINFPLSRPFFHFTPPRFRTFTRQADPSLEALRQKIIRRWLHMAAWIFLFPIPCLIVYSILTSSGVFR